MQTEADDCAREVLTSRFQGIFQPTHASSVMELPEETDVLTCSLGGVSGSSLVGHSENEGTVYDHQIGELETGWRESWSSNSVQSKMKQVLRLAKNRFTGRCVPWVVVDCGSERILDTADEGQPPIIAELVREFEQLGFRWAHRVVQPTAFGIPDDRGRLVFLASRHGDPREVLLVDEDTTTSSNMNSASDLASQRMNNKNAPTLFARCGFTLLEDEDEDGSQFQRATPKYKASTINVCADARPDRDSVVCSVDGQLAPLDVSDAESLQGLLPGWTVVSPPGVSRTSEAVVGEILNRWRALSATGGCVPLAEWIGRRLSDPYGNGKGFDSKRKSAQKFPKWCDGNIVNANEINPRDVRWATTTGANSLCAQEAAVAAMTALNNSNGELGGFKWPQHAYNIGHGRVSHPMKRIPKPEFLKHSEAREKTALKAYLRTTLENCAGMNNNPGGIEGYIPREVILACVRATREAGMAPPPPLAALERQFGGAGKEVAPPASRILAGADRKNLTGSHSERDLLAAETLLVTTTATASGVAIRNGGVGSRNGTDVLNVAGGKRQNGAAMNNNDNNNNNKESSKRQKSSLKPMGAAPVAEEVVEPDDGSFIVAGIRMMKPRESQIVWAKLPGHPHWPGLRVDEVKHGDVVPKAAKQMQKDGNDVCVVFFGEKSFGWLPETSIVDFEVGYKQHSHAPVRGKARFLNALKYANAEKELRKNEAKNGLANGNVGGRATTVANAAAAAAGPNGALVPPANPMGAVEPIDYEAVERNKKEVEKALLEGRCPCKMCENVKSIRDSNPETCLRLRCISASTSGKTGAKLASQGGKAVGKMISILWPLDDARYIAEVISYDARELKHLVRYVEDDVREYVSLWEEDVQFVRSGVLGEQTSSQQGGTTAVVKGEEELTGVDLLLSLGS